MNFQGFQNKGSQYLSFEAAAKLRTSLISSLNKKRSIQKQRKYFRFRKGDIAAQEMIDKNTNSFPDIMTSQDLLCQKFEIIRHEYRYDKFRQMPVDSEAIEGFTQAFDEMNNRLLNFQSFTHLSLGFLQKGHIGDTFEVLVLLTQMPMTVIITANAKSNVEGQARIIVGQVFDPQKVPVMVVLNQGKRSEVALGTSKIVYDEQASDEVKCHFFDRDVQFNPFAEEQITVHIYSVDRMVCSQFTYGQSTDYPQNSYWSPCYNDLLSPTIKDLEMNAFNALKEPSLRSILLKPTLSNTGLRERLMNRQSSSITGQIQNAVQNVSSVVEVKKTRAQILKEQKALEVKNRQNLQQAKASPAIPMGYSSEQNRVQNFQPPVTSAFSIQGFQPPLKPAVSLNFNLQAFKPLESKPQFISTSGSNFNVQGFKPPEQNPQISSASNFNVQGFKAPAFNPPSQPQSSAPLKLNQGGFTSSLQRFNTQPQTFLSRGNFSFGMNQLNNSLAQKEPLKLPEFNAFQNPTQKNELSFQAPTQPMGFQPPQPQPISVQPQGQSSKLKFSYSPMAKQPQSLPAFTFDRQHTTQLPTQTPLTSQVPTQAPPTTHLPTQTPLTSHLAFQAPFQQPSPQPTPQPIPQPLPIPQQLVYQPVQPIKPAQQGINAFSINIPQQSNFQTTPFQQRILNQLQLFTFDNAQMLKYLQNLEQELFNNQPKSLQQQNFINQLEHMILNEPGKFVEMVGKAESQMEPKPQKNFREKIMLQDDLGIYLTRIRETVRRVDEKDYERCIEQAEKTYVKSNVPDGQFREFILQKIFEKLILKDLPSRNESFKNLYEEHIQASRYPNSREAERCDLKILVGNQKFVCHQIVFKLGSTYFDQLIQYKAEKEARRRQKSYQFNFDMPHWMSPESFKYYVKYLYHGTLSDSKLSSHILFGLYKIAYCFRDYILEDHIVVQALIPNLSLSDAITYLIELQQMCNDPKRDSKFLLRDYCIHIVSKYLPKQLRSERQKLHQFDHPLLQDVIQNSFTYLKGDEQSILSDLDIVLKFTAEIFTGKDIFKLLMKISQRFRKAMAFDKQNVKKMRQFLMEVDPRQMYYCELIQDDEKQKEEEVKSCQDEKTFCVQPDASLSLVVQQNEAAPQDFYKISYEKWDPKSNVVLDSNGRPKITPIQKPCFEVIFNIGNLRREKRPSGLSIISKVFSAARRSWHLKLDLDSNQMLSAYIIERGLPLDQLSKGENFMFPNFSSTIVDFEFKYSNSEQKFQIFFSFAHNTNQIIGLSSILSLENLKDSDFLTVSISMKELFVHSALMNYICSNFTKLYQNSQKNNLMKLPFPLVYHLLNSNTLKVSDENMVLSFLFNYETDALDLLCQCLRYNYIELSKILSALRRSEKFGQSKEFIQRLRKEMENRVSQQSQSQEVQDEARLSYDISKVKRQDGMQTAMKIIEEVVQWAITATREVNVQKNESEKRKKLEFEKYQEELERDIQERRRVIDNRRLIYEQPPKIRDIYCYEEKEKEKLPEPKPFKLANEIAQAKRKSTSLPKFLQSNKENINPDSFHSLKMNQTLSPIKPPIEYQETQKAHRKIERARVSADFSCILKQLSTSPDQKQGVNSFQLNPISVPQNPLLNRQPRTKIPTTSNQQQESGGIISTIANIFQLK